MVNKEKIYHTLLEETLIILRKYIHSHINEMDDCDAYDICKLIRDIEQSI